jgi:hypothetical protein
MRASILAWSAFSGLVLGLLCGVAVLAVLVAGLEVLAPGLARATERWRPTLLVVCLVVLPLAGAVLGWLEGRLKLV